MRTNSNAYLRILPFTIILYYKNFTVKIYFNIIFLFVFSLYNTFFSKGFKKFQYPKDNSKNIINL